MLLILDYTLLVGSIMTELKLNLVAQLIQQDSLEVLLIFIPELIMITILQLRNDWV